MAVPNWQGQVSESIGQATNNVAEYRALIEGLKLAQRAPTRTGSRCGRTASF